MIEQKKKVLIINAYSYRNRGDAGIVVAMVDLIKLTFKNNVDISVMSQFHKENVHFYKKMNVRSVPPVWDILNQKVFIKKYFTGFKKVLFYKKQQTNEIINADLILSAGGGYLYSSKIGPLGIGFVNVLYHLWLSKKYKKKVVLFPQSVGPLKFSIDKIILKKVFSKIDVLYSRETITSNFIKEKKVKIRLEQLPDIAFILDSKKHTLLDANLKEEENYLKIGITVLDWRFAIKGSNPSDIEDYLSKISNTINDLKHTTEQKVKVYIFPQVTVSDLDGDFAVSIELHKKINEESEIINLDKIQNPKELIYLYSKMDIFIGSRMHSAIFSLVGNVPTIALAYQPKTLGTFNLIGLQEFVLDIRTFQKKDLQNKIIELIKSKSKIKEDVYGQVTEIRQKIIYKLSQEIKQ
ncbi:polysaccharide pyruvyl transferase family protein [Polaribacter sp.]|uniref:polysaccharide pyruvyl transferase family protein n=1 Tax=Polaribacter sp. TaxID=1920175 RepID=UPI003F697B71